MTTAKDAYDCASASLYADWIQFGFPPICGDPSTAHALGDVAGRSLVDFGCGSGRFLRDCAARGAAPLLGIDASQPVIEGARREHLRHFALAAADAEYRVADCFAPVQLTVNANFCPSRLPAD